MSNIFTDSDFLNNFIWPLVIVIITGVGILLKKKIVSFVNSKRKQSITVKVNVDKEGNLTINDKSFISKILRVVFMRTMKSLNY